MIKRAALARALALDPRLLFLDEPTSGLDPISAAAFDELLMELQEQLKLTVVMITHDLDTHLPYLQSCRRDRRPQNENRHARGHRAATRIPGSRHISTASAPVRGSAGRQHAWSVKPITPPSAPSCCWSWSWRAVRVLVLGLRASIATTRATKSISRAASAGWSAARPVRYLGVDVGRVVDMRIDPRDPSRVQVIVDIDSIGAGFRQDGRRALAAGRNRPAVHRPDPRQRYAAAPKAVPSEKYPVIRSAPSSFDVLLASLPDLVGLASDVADARSRMLSDQNIAVRLERAREHRQGERARCPRR